MRAFHGDVKLRLDPAPSDARILATTFNGKISSDIPVRSKDGFGVRFAEATLGKGEPVISIDVVTGDVLITTGRAPSPESRAPGLALGPPLNFRNQ